MKVFYKPTENKTQGVFIAYHDSGVPDDMYGTTNKTFELADIKDLQRVGDKTEKDKYFDTRLIYVPGSSLEELKRKGLTLVLSRMTEASNIFTSQYPQTEMLSWGTKEVAARLYLNKETLSASQNSMLVSEQVAGGYKDLDELCNVICDNAAKFMYISGTLAGLRSYYNTKIKEADSDVSVEYYLSELEDKLDSLSANLSSPAPANTTDASKN
jgi:hypothetical protein